MNKKVMRKEDGRSRKKKKIKFTGKQKTKCEKGNEKYQEKNREVERRCMLNMRRIKRKKREGRKQATKEDDGEKVRVNIR